MTTGVHSGTIMSKHIGLVLRIGASRDELTVTNDGAVTRYARSGMVGLQKKRLSRDVQAVRRFNAVAVAG